MTRRLTQAGLAEIASRLAVDVALWDQQGCLSPQLVYVLDPDPKATDRLAEALAHELALAEERWPRGRVEPSVSAAIAHARSDAELRAAAGGRVALHASSGDEGAGVGEFHGVPPFYSPEDRPELTICRRS